MNEFEKEGLPLSLSADGKRNGLHLACEPEGYRPAYAACLHKLAKENPSCMKFCASNTCVAANMRAEEVAAGHAIHFWERPRDPGLIETVVSVVKETAKRVVASIAPVTSIPVDKSPVIDTGDYASALNKALASKPETKKPAPTIPPSVEAIAGESPLAMARRLLGKQARKA